MGREVRKVPKDWQHPKNESGHYVPLFEIYGEDGSDGVKECELWNSGVLPDVES